MSDRLTLANAIEDAGIERSKAERVASVIIDAIHDSVATKADLAILATKSDLSGLRVDLAETKAEVLKWMVGAIGIQTVVIIGAVIALVRTMVH